MIFRISTVIVTFCLTFVICEPPSAQYGVPFGGQNNNVPISSYGTPNYNINNDNHEDNEPKSYEFGYQVKDDYSGNNYNRKESSDGNQVKGEYRVQLPDGRTQIVTYYADWQSGYHADVRYEGTATYPEDYNNNNHNTPSNQYGTPSYNSGTNTGYNNQGYHNDVNSLSNQYGTPNNNNYNNYNYNNNNGYSGSATSSVSIKDYSGQGTPYNTNSIQNDGYNYNNNAGNGYQQYDGYNNKGSGNTGYGSY